MSGSELTLAFGDGTSGELGLANDVTIALACPAASIEELGIALKEILGPTA